MGAGRAGARSLNRATSATEPVRATRRAGGAEGHAGAVSDRLTGTPARLVCVQRSGAGHTAADADEAERRGRGGRCGGEAYHRRAAPLISHMTLDVIRIARKAAAVAAQFVSDRGSRGDALDRQAPRRSVPPTRGRGRLACRAQRTDRPQLVEAAREAVGVGGPGTAVVEGVPA